MKELLDKKGIKEKTWYGEVVLKSDNSVVHKTILYESKTVAEIHTLRHLSKMKNNELYYLEFRQMVKPHRIYIVTPHILSDTERVILL